MNLREMALSPGRVDALDPPRLRLSVELQSLALAYCPPRVTVQIDWHSGPRAELRPLFELADDSRSQLDEYLELGRVPVVLRGRVAISHLQLVETTG